MPKVRIELPPVEAEDQVEIEVTVNGKKRRINYRVEILDWEAYAEPDDDRVTCLKRMVHGYDRDWNLVQIGDPSERGITILFERDEPTARISTN